MEVDVYVRWSSILDLGVFFQGCFFFFSLLRSPLLVLVQQRVVNSANSALVKDCRWQSPSEKDHPIQSYQPEKISNQIAILS